MYEGTPIGFAERKCLSDIALFALFSVDYGIMYHASCSNNLWTRSVSVSFVVSPFLVVRTHNYGPEFGFLLAAIGK
jgi:hypothetical protein